MLFGMDLKCMWRENAVSRQIKWRANHFAPWFWREMARNPSGYASQDIKMQKASRSLCWQINAKSWPLMKEPL
jgi:hypothetical protein